MPIQKIVQILFLVLLVASCLSCNNTKEKSIATENSNVNDVIEVYDFNSLEPRLYTDSNKTYLVNFWAMWCAPCVKELPYIEALAKKYPEVEVLLVSMDFPEDIDVKLKPFLRDEKITSEVVILDDPDSNTWIDKIDSNWSGAIPFTIIYNKEKRLFYERSFENLEDLETELNRTFKK
ncbi:TlpA family protein disulfide reductase [Winogradskyella endarachnes]|uniref:Redoxin domain-containing protein n=1 Tax=Winogradskyella endarachnes TaxID=2681965 RepID=A0A6L6UB05_9FLAO|nr:redoxin domain-containing protein [Winogradskyella endarachnes]MUU78716.1 redoxin domain-containing protein [Winogradskyella endarachnes]